ncbi:hypothetical protein BU15DRAFT_76850 [Melanogaster broomeanus]|nr:hypothetical protein BU15DRAFT_76850 [Melanogaster broomeanus]
MASSINFALLMEGVLRAAMGWHDVTPQVDFPLFIFPEVIASFHPLLALVWLRTGCDICRMGPNPPDNFSGFGELLQDGWHHEDVVQLLHDQHTAAPRRYLDALRTGQFSLPGRSRSLYMSHLALLVFVSRGASRFWTAVELYLNFVQRVVEYLNLPRETRPSASPAVYLRPNKEDASRAVIGNSGANGKADVSYNVWRLLPEDEGIESHMSRFKYLFGSISPVLEAFRPFWIKS